VAGGHLWVLMVDVYHRDSQTKCDSQDVALKAAGWAHYHDQLLEGTTSSSAIAADVGLYLRLQLRWPALTQPLRWREMQYSAERGALKQSDGQHDEKPALRNAAPSSCEQHEAPLNLTAVVVEPR